MPVCLEKFPLDEVSLKPYDIHGVDDDFVHSRKLPYS
jgi:hypothetical protein